MCLLSDMVESKITPRFLAVLDGDILLFPTVTPWGSSTELVLLGWNKISSVLSSFSISILCRIHSLMSATPLRSPNVHCLWRVVVTTQPYVELCIISIQMVRQTVTSDDTSQRNSVDWKQEGSQYRALRDPTCQWSVFRLLSWYANSLTPVSQIAHYPPKTLPCNADLVLECVTQDAVVDSVKRSAHRSRKRSAAPLRLSRMCRMSFWTFSKAVSMLQYCL